MGAYVFSSGKAARKQAADGCQVPAEPGRCVAHMFVMHVAEELPTWPEGGERKRIWVSLDSSIGILRQLLGVRRGCLFLCILHSAVYRDT